MSGDVPECGGYLDARRSKFDCKYSKYMRVVISGSTGYAHIVLVLGGRYGASSYNLWMANVVDI